MKKFQTNLALFQKYSGEYGFDYLMMAAQGYQESLLDQSKRNPSGAVGIMQVIPKNAAAAPISIPNVLTADGNIHAGVKMMRNIEDTYFNDPKIDSLNKTLFVFASYNAGPNRVGKLRKDAASWALTPTSGSTMWSWLPPKRLGRRPSPTSPISTSITSLTSWQWCSGRSGRKRKDCRGIRASPHKESPLSCVASEKSGLR